MPNPFAALKDQLRACADAVEDTERRFDAVVAYDPQMGKGQWRTRPDAAYERDLDEKKPVRVSGVKGVKSASFSKTFPNMAAYERWADKSEAGDYEVHRVEQA